MNLSTAAISGSIINIKCSTPGNVAVSYGQLEMHLSFNDMATPRAVRQTLNNKSSRELTIAQCVVYHTKIIAATEDINALQIPWWNYLI